MKNVLVIGLGRFGQHTVRKLTELGEQVMAVDRSEDKVQSVMNVAADALIGDSTNPAFLATLGVESFDVCSVAIGDDFLSALETTVLLKEAGAHLVVSRATQDLHEKLLLQNGADSVIYPEKQLAEWTAICYSSESILDYFPLSDSFGVYELETPESWEGKTLAQLDLRKKNQINVIAVRRNGMLKMDLPPDEPLCAGETLLVIGRDSEIRRFTK